MAEDLEKVLFEMRASPHEARKLLASLYPQGPSRAGEIQLPFTPTPASRHDGSGDPVRGAAGRAVVGQDHPPVPEGALEIDLGDLAASGRVGANRRRRGRRKWLALGALGGAARGVGRRSRISPQRATAGGTVRRSRPTGAAATPPAGPNRPPPPPAAKPAAVEVSLDSSPQDAQVIREDSGEVVGRTPLTITLPQGRERDLVPLREGRLTRR